jgi:hypothetical protein
MSSMLQISWKSGASAATVKGRLRMDSLSGFIPSVIERLATFVNMTAGGVHSGRYTIATSAVQASATATFVNVVAGNSVTVGGVAFTGHDSTTTSVQFLTGTTDTISAASLASQINANSTANKLVHATSALGVVTISSIVPGKVGNFITLTAVGSPITVTGSGFLADGDQDAPKEFYNGLA